MSFKAKRCKCGCGLPTAGGDYLPGHNTRHGRHWSKMESRSTAIANTLKKRRQMAYRLLAEGKVHKDFSADYFDLFRRIQSVRPDAELEVIVEMPEGFRALDVGVPILKMGWEWDPGNRYHLGTASDSKRDKDLTAAGWLIIHCKSLPEVFTVQREVERRLYDTKWK